MKKTFAGLFTLAKGPSYSAKVLRLVLYLRLKMVLQGLKCLAAVNHEFHVWNLTPLFHTQIHKWVYSIKLQFLCRRTYTNISVSFTPWPTHIVAPRLDSLHLQCTTDPQHSPRRWGMEWSTSMCPCPSLEEWSRGRWSHSGPWHWTQWSSFLETTALFDLACSAWTCVNDERKYWNMKCVHIHRWVFN